MVSIHNTTRNTVLAGKAEVADSFLKRMIGLLRRESLASDEGLVITRCQSIHMLFMRFSIDAVFVDKNKRVVGLVERIRPFRFSPIFFRASCCVELAEGTIAKTHTAINDSIELIPI